MMDAQSGSIRSRYEFNGSRKPRESTLRSAVRQGMATSPSAPAR